MDIFQRYNILVQISIAAVQGNTKHEKTLLMFILRSDYCFKTDLEFVRLYFNIELKTNWCLFIVIVFHPPLVCQMSLASQFGHVALCFVEVSLSHSGLLLFKLLYFELSFVFLTYFS